MPQSRPVATELLLGSAQRSLGTVLLDWQPYPGAYLEFEGCTYTVLERRHRYRFQGNRYRLHTIQVQVQAAPQLQETSWVGDRQVLGDTSCRYNAHSELVRCAINPTGPCQDCSHHESA